MNKNLLKSFRIMLVLLLCLTAILPLEARANETQTESVEISVDEVTIETAYKTVGEYLINKITNPSFGDEWSILTLARGDYLVPEGYFDTYYQNIVEHVKSVDGVLDKRKYTEYSRTIIALAAIGKDARDVGGYNLVEKLYDFDQVIWQGINGAIFGLIALDTWQYELPEGVATTRNRLIKEILSKEIENGGFALSGKNPDPDITAMALQALSSYEDVAGVAEVIERGLTVLSDIQTVDGGYKSWGTANSESVAQVITALASLGIDPTIDPKFDKIISNMLTFYSDVDGGFKHVVTEQAANGMATDQAGYTLVAYNRLKEGKTKLYDMADTKPSLPDSNAELSVDSKIQGDTVDPTISVTLIGDTFTSGAEDKANWALQASATGLEVNTISKESDQKVTIAFKGKAKAGTLTLTALVGALKGNKVSEELSIVILEPESVPEEEKSLDVMIEDTVQFYKNKNTELTSWWTIMALWGAGENLLDGSWKLPIWKTEDPGLDENTGDTEHIRYIFSLLAMGEEPSSAWETNRNLYAELAKQQKNGAIGGMNKHVWAMLALDTGEKLNQDVGTWDRDKKQQALKHVLDSQNSDGGFAGDGTDSDTDITGMALLALGNYQGDSAVNAAIERAKDLLRERQLDTGGFDSPGAWGMGENSNSHAASVSGLVAAGENILSQNWTVKGKTVVDAFKDFQLEDGSFMWKADMPGTNPGSTEQALVALTDIQTGKSVWQRIAGQELPEQDSGVVEVKPGKEFVLDDNVQKDIYKPVVLDFGKLGIQVLPKVIAERGNAKLEIPEGTQITSQDWDGKIQVPTTLATSEGVKTTIDAKLGDRKISKMGGHIKVGGDKPIEFGEYVTLKLSGYGADEAGFIDASGTFGLITKYPTKADAEKATEDVYAYPEGKDLIIKTKHFTEFLTFETEAIEPEKPGTGGGGGGTTAPSTKTVTLSVEKRTMDDTDIIKAMDVSLQSGDTAFTLLKRVVGEKGISIDYIGSDATLYVQAIQGLGEFDGGPDSGWMYSVNGIYPNYSAGLYTLKDGDVLRWRYTRDLGHDIGGGYVPEGGSPEGSPGGTPGGPGGPNPGPNPEPKPEAEEIVVKMDEPFVLDKKFQNNVTTPVIANFGNKKELPKVTAQRGDALLEIAQGTKVTSDWDGKLQLPTSLSPGELDLKAINTVLGLNGKDISKVDFRLKVGGAKSIKFDRRVTLTLKNQGDSEVGFIDEKGTFKRIKKHGSAVIGSTDEYAYQSGKDLIIKTNHFTEFVTFKPTVIDKPIVFTDVKDNWAKEFIEKAAQTGIIKGYPDGTFQPNKTVTRAQAASIIVRGLELTTDKSAPFKDIGSYAKETQAEIAAAYQHGIVIGQQGNFNPSGGVTRSQLALMLHRAYTQKIGKEYVAKQTAPYPDIGNFDKETVNAISMLYELEIATGSEGKYNPTKSTTRAQAAKMFVNFFEHLER